MSVRLIGVLAAMVALLTAGLATGTRIYYNLFYILLLLIAYGLLSVLWTIFTVKIGMKGVRPRVERGETLMTILSVEHKSLLPAGNLRVMLQVPGSSAVQEISVSAPPFLRRTFRNVVRCPHRGNYEVGIAGIAAEDPFGLFCFSRKQGKRMLRVEVYPKVKDVPPMRLKASDIGPEFQSRATEDAASPSDVRKWQDGDVLKKVHWKLSLRKRELMVRTFEESARPDTLVIPDLSEITALQDQRLTMEDCICEASLSAVKAQLEEGFPVRMPLQCRRPQELSGRSIVDLPGFTDALMRVNFDSSWPYEQVLMLMMQRMQRTGGAILVTGRLSSRIADIAMRMQRTGIQVKMIWITDAPRSESLEMLERMKMSGVKVEMLDPWMTDAAPENQHRSDADDAFDALDF